MSSEGEPDRDSAEQYLSRLIEAARVACFRGGGDRHEMEFDHRDLDVERMILELHRAELYATRLGKPARSLLCIARALAIAAETEVERDQLRRRDGARDARAVIAGGVPHGPDGMPRRAP